MLSPDDATFEELDVSPGRGVQELLVVDPEQRTVRCFALQEAQAERERSEVLGTTAGEVADAVDWPPLDD